MFPTLQKSPNAKLWAHRMLALYTQFHPWSIPVIHICINSMHMIYLQRAFTSDTK
ncbi:hypothetical protein JHK85_016089 [Glycine max]|uniref:Uncharacterized protein n=1 Tax=Glycine max TaxID=3847 RepID=K7KVW2_SOYBN|nr:hypothetical protein JHK85_016089 [Glycine max]